MLYRLFDGVTMGSPLGPTLAYFCLLHFEMQLLHHCSNQSCHPVLYLRYVGDIFCVFQRDLKCRMHDFKNVTIAVNSKYYSQLIPLAPTINVFHAIFFLRWVMWVERLISQLDEKLVFQQENIRKVCYKLSLIQQMQRAPDMYARLVVEVVRRRNYSQDFLRWANMLADDCSTSRQKEVKKREIIAENTSKCIVSWFLVDCVMLVLKEDVAEGN